MKTSLRLSVPLSLVSAALLAACSAQRMGTITPPPSSVTGGRGRHVRGGRMAG
jgi:hypothetical protein